MKIYDDQARERVRFFNYWTKFKPDREDSLTFFRPKNVMTHLQIRIKTMILGANDLFAGI